MADELTPSEAARRIGTTTRSVQRWIAHGRLPARRVGGRWRVASDALDAFSVASGTAAAPQPDRPPPAERAPGPNGAGRITTLFIANRGEIAARIRRTADRLGIRSVIPGRDEVPAIDLLDPDAIVAAARAAAADAIHPGYGFLSENASLAAAVDAAGIRWIGPPADAIRAMGDKASARRIAASLDVPVLPGYDDADQSDATFRGAAAEIGYPVLVKPAAGGGGKGMHVVREPGGLDDALALARREAALAFGDDRLILERYLDGPRHVEIQVLFDGVGSGVHLGERDCSLQRRHQKVLEETPSPAIDDRQRRRMGDAALRLAGSVGYQSAGTCEFLVDSRGRFYFLEMNTRLQVEHPVTELVTGRDLVADQLRIGEGRTLRDIGVSQVDIDAAIERGGHAAEVRLYAEDAENGFLPATGPILALTWPSGDGVRVDAGIAVGDEVGPRFDPMLAKVVVHGADRSDAFERLRIALDETVIVGLTTNLRFLRWLVRQPVVLGGQVRIDTLERIWPPADWADRARIPDEAWDAAAGALIGPRDARRVDPFSAGWRLTGPPSVRLVAEGEERTVSATPEAAGETTGDANTTGDASTAGSALSLVRHGDEVHVDVAGRSIAFRAAPPPDVDRAAQAAATHGAGAASVIAPMPGAVVAVFVARDASVAAGAPIVTLEAMKMEHVVVAPIDGRVADLSVRAGDQVARGQALATIEPPTP